MLPLLLDGLRLVLIDVPCDGLVHDPEGHPSVGLPARLRVVGFQRNGGAVALRAQALGLDAPPRFELWWIETGEVALPEAGATPTLPA